MSNSCSVGQRMFVGKQFFFRYFYRSFLALFVLFCGVMSQEANAQRGPAMGDIIQYEDISGKTLYGLVLGYEFDGAVIKIENVSPGGDFRSDTVQAAGRFNWKLIDSAGKSQATAQRTWATSSGKFKIEAKLVGVEGSSVQLEKPDGSIVTVPVSKLSSKDQSFVRKNKDAVSAESGEDDWPENVYLLRKRRDELIVIFERHKKLAKMNPNLQVGDIVFYKDFIKGQRYGLVTDIGLTTNVQFVNKSGELEDDQIAYGTEWSFFDRDLGSQQLDSRKWSSTNGTFTINAKLIGVDGDMLALEKTSGETINVPASKLSKVDQSYVKRVRKKLESASSKEMEQARAGYGATLQKLLDRRNELLKRESANRVAAKASAKMKSISLNTKPPKLAPGELRPYSIDKESLSNSASIKVADNGRLTGLCYAKDAGLVALTAGSPFQGKTTLAVMDVESGDIVTNIESDDCGSDASVVAISPSGETLIVFSGGMMTKKELELWKYQNGQLVKKSLITYDSQLTPMAHLFSDEEGVIMNSTGTLAFFKLEGTILPTHQISGGRMSINSSFEISEDQKKLLYFDTSASAIGIVDVETKKCIGGLRLKNDAKGSLFSFVQLGPEGETVSAVTSGKLTVYSLETGQPIAEHELSTVMSGAKAGRGSFQFLAPDLALLAGRSIFDFRLGLEIGSLDLSIPNDGTLYFGNGTRLMGSLSDQARGGFGGSAGGAIGGANMSRMSDHMNRKTDYYNTPVSVTLQRLPTDEIVQFANSLTEADVVEFDAGDKVKLVFDIGNNQSVESRIRSKIASVMGENNIGIADESDFVLEFHYSVGETQTRTYQIIGGINGTETRTESFTPTSCSAKLTYKGSQIWGNGDSASLGRVWSEEELDKQLSKKVSVNRLLEFKYPNKIRIIDPKKQRDYRWQ